jgi:DNA-binding SARP family transcriptional activator/transposase
VDRRRIAKFTTPRASQIVRRARVLTAIDRALRSGACWIAAPAGYGKTVAMTDYLQKTATPSVWYRIDEGDQDVASFFHYMALSVQGIRTGGALLSFGAEYADQLTQFARRFFRTYLAKLRHGTVLVLDDVHNADVPQFRTVLAILLAELPPTVRCACVSRTLPSQEFTELTIKEKLTVVGEAVLKFTDPEALSLVKMRLGRSLASSNIELARGWAAGLVLLSERASAAARQPEILARAHASTAPAAFAALAGQLIDNLPQPERDLLMKVSVLPEITPEIVRALGGATVGQNVLDALHRRQLLVTRGKHGVFHLHDLLREYLRNRLSDELSPTELARLMEHAAGVLDEAGYVDAAMDLAVQSQAWPLARRLISAHAATLLAQGRRATLVDHCAALPHGQLDAWLCYWLGVAAASDDATAESWFARAWELFSEQDDPRGLCLTAAHAVLAKADSWRTHEGLAVWTARAIELLDRDLTNVTDDEQLLVWTGMLRAVDFAATSPGDTGAVERLTRRLVDRLAKPAKGDSTARRLFASEALIEHAGTTGERALFERAVDSVAADLRDRSVSPWVLGLWLVAFGAISARYFAYARRGFPYASPEDALRAAIAIGQRESLRGVEFGGLYHLQLQMKSRNDFTEFAALIERLAEIADSRYTTQVAVVADCQAAWHTVRRDFIQAHAACDRFMAAIEAANEPPLERWPHFITQFQVLLAERQPARAAEFLTELAPLYSGALRQRTEACVRTAHAFAAKWTQDERYPSRLRDCIQELRAANWPAALLNIPDLLAALCADALELEIEPEFCRSLITRRALVPPALRPPRWPWLLRVHVLGEFRLDRDGVPLDLGPKPSTRSLDIVRVLAVAKDHTCAVQQIYDWLWPDADGDQAKAACEQALHRLRRLLGRPDLVVQREGRLRLAHDKVWVDLDFWEARLAGALSSASEGTTAEADLNRAVMNFPGPLLSGESWAPWLMPTSERLRASFIEVVMRLGKSFEQGGDPIRACEVYRRALDAYPTSERCYEALLRARLAMGDTAGALEDYYRCERTLATMLQSRPAPSIRALVANLLPSGATV